MTSTLVLPNIAPLVGEQATSLFLQIGGVVALICGVIFAVYLAERIIGAFTHRNDQ